MSEHSDMFSYGGFTEPDKHAYEGISTSSWMEVVSLLVKTF
jgi:hypothetical protein